MSLLWRNHLRVGLCPDRLLLATYGRGTKPARTSQQSIEVQAGPADAPEWRAALEALPDALAAAKHPEASVVLADQFVRYALLPWNESLRTADQWQALARHRFQGIYGAFADAWDIKVTETAPGGPRLACALERDLLEELAVKFAGSGVSLVSVQPFLVAAFNQLSVNAKKHSLGNGTCWLLVEEPGRLTLALLLRGVWTAVRSRRVDERWRMVLPQILERESAFLGLEQPCTSVFACTQGEFDAGMHEDFRTQSIDYGDLATAWG